MSTPLRLTTIQCDLLWHDVPGNLRQFSALLRGLEGSTDIIVLPEMFTTGFSMHNTPFAGEMDGEPVRWMKEEAVKANAVIVGSAVIKAENGFVNRMLWVTPDGAVQHYDKRHLFRFAGEHNVYTPGNQRLIVEHKGWKILLLVCFDLRFPVWSRNVCRNPSDHVNSMDYDLAIYVANWPEARRKAWSTLLEARAHENQCYIVGVNRVGTDGNGIVYSGDTAVISPRGEKITNTPPGTTQVETVAISMNDLREFREKFPVALEADDFRIDI